MTMYVDDHHLTQYVTSITKDRYPVIKFTGTRLVEKLNKSSNRIQAWAAKWGLEDVYAALVALDALYTWNEHYPDAMFAPLLELFSTSEKPDVVYRGITLIDSDLSTKGGSLKPVRGAQIRDVLSAEHPGRYTSSWATSYERAQVFTGSRHVLSTKPRVEDVLVVPPDMTAPDTEWLLQSILCVDALDYRDRECEVILFGEAHDCLLCD